MSASAWKTTCCLEKGVFATNAQLVEKAAQVVEGMGAKIIGPARAREILNLRAPQ